MHARLLRLFRRLLALYPATLRDEYGSDMVQVLGDQLRGRGPAPSLGLFAKAVADVVRTAPREQVAALRAQPVGAVVGVGATVPLREPRVGPSRRQFLRGALGLTVAGVGSGFAGATLAFLWPNVRGGFGALIDIGTADEISKGIAGGGGILAVPSARAYLVAYDPADDPEGLYAEVTAGSPFMALYQRCVHLGCRVPWCVASTRFECPCHKSRYNRWGEYQDGPAPRGLDRFPVSIDKGRVMVDTRAVTTGPSRLGGALTEGPTGPSCVLAT